MQIRKIAVSAAIVAALEIADANKPAEGSECLHLKCTSCNGGGRKSNGDICAHYISCPCSRCSPRM